MTTTPEENDFEQHWESLRDKAGGFLEQCQFRSAMRIYSEIRRLARAEQKLIPYMLGVFHLMDVALDLLDPQTTRTHAVELIALLESPERARHMQADFPEAAYEYTCGWMTACAYENLAEATGRLDGYNSEGMHSCITDGIQVCRRTGKMACVRCFREYATEVYTAADDLALAGYHAHTIAAHQGEWSNRGNRHWYGLKVEASLLLLSGQVEPAQELLEHAWRATDETEVSVPRQAKLCTAVDVELVELLSGKLYPRALDANDPQAPTTLWRAQRAAADEYPTNHLWWEMNDAVAACCREDYASAIAILSRLDRQLSEQRCLSLWFEARLRLLATHRLAGNDAKLPPLAEQLHTRAQQAHDWLTLRRLQAVFDPACKPSPVAALAPLTSGPFADVTRAAVPAAAPPVQEPAQAAELPETPYQELFHTLAQRLENASDETVQNQVLAELLSHAPASISHPLDAARLLYLLQFLIGAGERAEEIWAWAQAVAQPHPQVPPVLNLLAAVGDILRHASGTPAQLIQVEQLEKLYKNSLALDPHNPVHFARAGGFYLSIDNLGEAERCLARGFRLERRNGFMALRLAEVYRQTERPRDALMVLDMCLREGGDDPQLAWEAGLLSFHGGHFDSLLTYMDRHEQMLPGRPWTQFYRALGLLELRQPEQALAAINVEAGRTPHCCFAHEVVRACACSALGQVSACQAALSVLLGTPLVEVDYLTPKGLADMAERLWKAVLCLPEEDAQRVALEELLLMAGLTPDDYFERKRQRGEVQEELQFFRCLVSQPLDAGWPRQRGCLAGEADWIEYMIPWGVLARTEEEARAAALRWQQRTYPAGGGSVESVELADGTYRDKPGVVWQGFRAGRTAAETTEA